METKETKEKKKQKQKRGVDGRGAEERKYMRERESAWGLGARKAVSSDRSWLELQVQLPIGRGPGVDVIPRL